MTLVAFKNLRIFSVSSLRWKILNISTISWVLKLLIPQTVFILLKPSMLLTFWLELDSLIAKLLTLQLNLMHIWHPRGGKPLSNPSLYRWLIGSLVYLTVTRPDISYVAHQVSQYLFAPQSTHYAALLHILWYLKGTLFHGLILTQLFDCSKNTSSLLILLHMQVWRHLPYKKLGRLGGITSVGWKRLITYHIQETKHGWRATDPKDAYQKIWMFLLTIGILWMQWYVA